MNERRKSCGSGRAHCEDWMRKTRKTGNGGLSVNLPPNLVPTYHSKH